MSEENCIGCQLQATNECLKEKCERSHHTTPLNPDKVSEQMKQMFDEHNAPNREGGQ